MRKASDLLKEERLSKNLTLDDIERETKIKKEFIEAIEEGRFHDLPSESHAQGFVKNYGKFLGLSESSFLPLFRRENRGRARLSIVPEFRRSQHKFNRNFFLSPKTFVIVFSIIIVSIYIFFQYSSLIFAPRLSVVKPKNGEVLSTNIVEVRGKTDPYAQVSVNGDETYVSLNGTFEKSIYGYTGENKIEIVSKNRFGKESKRVIIVKIK